MTNIAREVFKCRCGCGFNTIDYEIKKIYDFLEKLYINPVIIHSGCRCVNHNRIVGGSSRSMHLWARAMDFHVDGIHNISLFRILDTKYQGLYGIGLYNWGIHIDSRTRSVRWVDRKYKKKEGENNV